MPLRQSRAEPEIAKARTASGSISERADTSAPHRGGERLPSPQKSARVRPLPRLSRSAGSGRAAETFDRQKPAARQVSPTCPSRQPARSRPAAELEPQHRHGLIAPGRQSARTNCFALGRRQPPSAIALQTICTGAARPPRRQELPIAWPVQVRRPALGYAECAGCSGCTGCGGLRRIAPTAELLLGAGAVASGRTAQPSAAAVGLSRRRPACRWPAPALMVRPCPSASRIAGSSIGSEAPGFEQPSLNAPGQPVLAATTFRWPAKTRWSPARCRRPALLGDRGPAQ